MAILYVVISLLIFLILCVFAIIYLRLKKPNKTSTDKTTNNPKGKITSSSSNEDGFLIKKTISKALQKDMEDQINLYQKKQMDLDILTREYNEKLAHIANVNVNDAKQIIMDSIKTELKSEINSEIKEAKKELLLKKEALAQNILVEVLERTAEPMIQERTTTTIKLSDDSMKGRVIGKEGRNKRSFELLTGVDIIIDRDTPSITLSSANPVRRELAARVMHKLVSSKNIEPSRIELIFDEEKNKFDAALTEYGREALEDKLEILDIEHSLYPIVGRLKFRTSYGQNALDHSIECANYANHIAIILNLDKTMAKKAAFFHDIGKSIDFEIDNDHVASGLKIASEYNLPDYIINAIGSHHNQTPVNNIYSSIVKIVDTLSAARPGARADSFDEYIKRVTTLEKICDTFPEVAKSYAIKSGRQIRIIVKPSLVKDDELEFLARKIQKEIEKNDATKNNKITVVVIKESRFQLDTNK